MCLTCLMAITSPAYADIFDDMQHSLKVTNKRQQIISQNLANADTPGYKAKKVLPLKPMNSIGLKTTSPTHITTTGWSGSSRIIEDNNTRYETLDGNTVVVEDQMLEMNKNNLEHRMTLGMLQKMTGLMRTAIGKQ